jgi:hypothetical protein
VLVHAHVTPISTFRNHAVSLFNVMLTINSVHFPEHLSYVGVSYEVAEFSRRWEETCKVFSDYLRVDYSVRICWDCISIWCLYHPFRRTKFIFTDVFYGS